MVSADFKYGDKVKILSGPFEGEAGKIIVSSTAKNSLALKVRDCAVLVEIDMAYVEKI